MLMAKLTGFNRVPEDRFVAHVTYDWNSIDWSNVINGLRLLFVFFHILAVDCFFSLLERIEHIFCCCYKLCFSGVWLAKFLAVCRIILVFLQSIVANTLGTSMP